MNKKAIVILSIIGALNIYADDNDDIKFIYKLYQNKDYKVSVDELNKFMIKYPSSKYYDVAQNLLGQSYYNVKEYDKAQKIFSKLTTSAYSNDAYYYLSLIDIELNNPDEAYDYAKNLKDINKERILYNLAVKEYSNNNLSKAKGYFEELRRQKGTYRNIALFNLGLISYNSGAYLDSTVYMSEFLTVEKDDVEKLATGNYIMGFSYNRLNNKELSLQYYTNIEKNYINSSYYNLALRDLLFFYTDNKNEDKIKEYTDKLRGTQFSEVALLNTGNYYFNNGDYVKAIPYYADLPQNNDAIYYSARAYFNNGDMENALKQFAKLSNIEKYSNDYYYYTAYIYFQQGKYKEVVTLLNGVENKLNKNLLDFYKLIGDSSYKLEDYDKSSKYYGLIFNEKKSKDDFYKYYLVSSLKGDTKTLQDLFDYYRKNLIKDKTYNESVYLIMGNTYAKAGDDEKASSIYTEGLKNEYSSTLLENLVVVQTRLKNYDEAMKNLNRLDTTPDREYTRGTLLLSMKKYPDAIGVFEDLSKDDSDKELQGKVLTKLAEGYLLEKQYAKTIETSDRYEKLNKVFNKEMANLKAIAYFRLGQYAKARELYEKGIAESTDKGYSYYMVAETYYNEKKYNEAKENYGKAFDTSNDTKIKKDSSYWQIRIEEALGNKKALFERVEAFRKSYPNSEYDEDITYLVARIYEADRDRKNAINEYTKLYNLSGSQSTKDEMAKRITELYFDDKDIKNAYIWVAKVNEDGYKYLWQGYIMELEKKDADAVKNYEKIVNDKNYGDSANFKLGSYYLTRADYKKARSYFEAVMNFELSSNKERAQYNIGITYEKELDYMKAISSYLRIKLLMENSELDDLVTVKLAENYEKLNNSDKAYDYYKEYFDKYSNRKDYSYVVEKLVVNRINSDKLSEAKNFYKELQRINPDRAKIYADYMK